jgi:hypothetical protein
MHLVIKNCLKVDIQPAPGAYQSVFRKLVNKTDVMQEKKLLVGKVIGNGR